MSTWSAVKALAAGLVLCVAASGCSGGSFISQREQSARLVSAEAFGALVVVTETADEPGFPGPSKRRAAAAWAASALDAVAVADQRFQDWAVASGQLSFVPAAGPGPDQEQVAGFNTAYSNWSATRSAFARAIRGCDNSRKNKVARRCMKRAALSSAAGRLSADTTLHQSTATIHLSYVAVSDPTAAGQASNG